MRRLVAVLVVTVVGFSVGCGGSGADKVSGVRRAEVATLTLANGNDSPVELQPWLDEVRRLSGGRLRIRVLSRWREGEPRYEAGLVADVRSGRVQLGWVGARAWAAEGVHSFDALDVPFFVDSYSLEEAALSPAVRRGMLAGVSGAGVQPVGLLPGPLRFLLARRPVTSVADLRGLRIGVGASRVGERALRVVGAAPVPLGRGAPMTGLDAVEGRLGTLAGAYLRHARYLTADAPLWPRPLVLFANRKAWAALSSSQMRILQDAAADVFGRMLREEEADDRAAMAQLCDGGVQLVTVGARGDGALRAAVAPIVDSLRNDAAARTGVDAVERARGQSARAAPLACKAPPLAREPALSGAFAWTLRRGEAHPGIAHIDFEGARAIRFWLVLRNGRAVQSVVYPDGHREAGFDEKYRVYRDRIAFGGDHGPPLTARWRLDGDKLSFSEMNGGPDDRFVWESHSWVRVAG